MSGHVNLHISGAQPGDSGHYSCTAKNENPGTLREYKDTQVLFFTLNLYNLLRKKDYLQVIRLN